MANQLLLVEDLQVNYDGIRALHGISLEVKEGEIVTLIGANGAGKSTTLAAIAGLVPPASGKVIFNGKETTGLPAHLVARNGISLVPEGRRIFPNLTVKENLLLGAYPRSDRAGIQGDLEQVFQLFPRLTGRGEQVAGTLSGGEQQMLAMGRALMARPRLLLLDEPSLGLAPFLVKEVFRWIGDIRANGTTVLLVEQNARMALAAADRGYVLETGKIVLADSASALQENPQVQQAYLGKDEG